MHWVNVNAYATTSADETIERVRDADVIITNKVVINDAVMRICAPFETYLCSSDRDE